MVDFSIALWWFTLLILVQNFPSTSRGGEVSRKKRTWKNRGFGDPTQVELFVWIPKSFNSVNFKKKTKPDLLDLQDSGTSHHQDDMNQSKIWWWKQIPRIGSNPPIRAFVLFDSLGWREPRSSAGGFLMAFESHVFFRRCVFSERMIFWDHSEWPKPEVTKTGNVDNQKLDPQIFAYGATRINWWYWCFFLTWIHYHQNTKR